MGQPPGWNRILAADLLPSSLFTHRFRRNLVHSYGRQNADISLCSHQDEKRDFVHGGADPFHNWSTFVPQKLGPIDSIDQLVEIVSDEVLDSFVGGRRGEAVEWRSFREELEQAICLSFVPAFHLAQRQRRITLQLFYTPRNKKRFPPIIIGCPKKELSDCLINERTKICDRSQIFYVAGVANARIG